MTRRCSHCSNNGHNSRTCPTKSCVKLFGVRLTDGSIIKKSASMGNLSALYNSSSSAAASPNPSSPPFLDPHVTDGYLSDDPTAHTSCSASRRAERKKGVPWTEEEHKLFLLGLQKLGKGDWRGISRNFVMSRTPTQVASHAQKYFIRQTSATRRKRRSSLFDMVSDMATDPPVLEDHFMLPPQASESEKANALPSLDLSLKPDFAAMEEAKPHEMVEETKETATPSDETEWVTPVYFPPYIPVPFALWPTNAAAPLELEGDKGVETSHHQVLKPIPMLPLEPVNVDELVGMSQLSLGKTETEGSEPSPLSLKLLGEPSRQSAFHASTQV